MAEQIRGDASLRTNLDWSADAQRAAFTSSGWWHSIDLGGGLITAGAHSLDHLRDNFARFGLPEDMTGRRVLDIGCWDGFYSFEAERRGASVVAVDCWRPETFFFARNELKSRVEFHEMSVYEISRAELGSFDIVLFLGVLYHLPDPLLALRRVCEMTREVAIIESHVIDHLLDSPRPIMEFYEIDELGGQYDNWWGPNLECLQRMTRAAGFARTEVLRHEAARAVIKAYRRWEEYSLTLPPRSHRIREVVNAVMLGRRLSRRGRFAQLSIFVEGLPTDASRESVFVEVSGFGCNTIYVIPPVESGDAGRIRLNKLAAPGKVAEPAVTEATLTCTQIVATVPLGLDAGPALLRVRYEDGPWAETMIELSESGEW